MDKNLWEFSLFFPRELLNYFEELKLEFKRLFINEKNCVSILIDEDKYIFMFALTKEIYNKNILYIKEKIADIILLYYKPKIIVKSIKNFNLNNHENVVLIDILSNFDLLEDKNHILQKLSLCEKLYLESFVNFKIPELVKRWKEVGDLINENSLFLIDQSVRKELMQFLMQGISSKENYAKLVLNGNNIRLFNEKNELSCPKIYYSIFDYDSTLFSLIKASPKKIEVEDYRNFNVNFIQTLSDLFGDRLYLI